MTKDFDFSTYVERKRSGSWGRDEGVRYAYSADLAMLKSFQRVRPVELAAASVVRTSKEWMKSDLLGSTVKVGPDQFPSIHKIAEHCATVLTVPTPTVLHQEPPQSRTPTPTAPSRRASSSSTRRSSITSTKRSCNSSSGTRRDTSRTSTSSTTRR